MKRLKTGLVLLAAAASASGCATVIRGSKDNAHFMSDPAGATVTVESLSADRLGPFTCVTPCMMELKRKRDWQVVYNLDGYAPVETTLNSQVTGGGVASGAGNLLIGGIIGVGVDAGTGANKDLRPNPMIAELAEDGAGPSRILSEAEADIFRQQIKSGERVVKRASARKTASQEDAPAQSAPASLMTEEPVNAGTIVVDEPGQEPMWRDVTDDY